MPEAKRQRDEAYRKLRDSGYSGSDGQLRFVHYTSAEAALNIIRTKQLWMRNTTCMSDYSEVQHGFDILNKFFADNAKRSAFVAALDTCSPDGGTDKMQSRYSISGGRDILFGTYVASISEHDASEDMHGRLSMWRAFGGDAVRVALVFRVPHFSQAALALNLLFSPVAYLTEVEVHAVIEEMIKNIYANGDFLKQLNQEVITQMVLWTLIVGCQRA